MAGPATTLDDLCGLMGVERTYEAAGELHTAPEAAVHDVLRTLGAPLSPDADLARAATAVRLERLQRIVEPVSVCWEGGANELVVRVTGSEVRDDLEVRLVREDGAAEEHRVPAADVRWNDALEVDARAFRRGLIDLPADLPVGYHDVTVRVGAREARTRLVRAPRTTWDGPEERWRQWGTFLPLHAVRSASDWGVGDIGDLGRLARWTRARGGNAVGTLPLLASFLGTGSGGTHVSGPYEPSPYAPASRLYWNELFLDVERAPGLDDVAAAREALEADDVRREVEALRRAGRADPRRTAALKRRVLEPVALAVAGAGGASTGRVESGGFSGPLERFLDDRPGALEYARFRAFGEAEGSGWPSWPAAARAGALRPGEAPADAVVWHLYAQWAMDDQVRALDSDDAASLYLDLPLGCHADGYDVWKHRDLFARDASGGAPPDAFFAGGQDWGFPPVHPARARADGHTWFIASLRHLMRACGTLRIDHVMSLHRLFWVPSGGRPADGVYVRYPRDELWAVLCLESRRHRCEIVGEDLGTVPDEVRKAMHEHGARRMWVLPFEVAPAATEPDPPRYDPPDRRSVASLDTHDMPPFAAFWEGADIDTRIHSGHLAPEEAAEEAEARARWRAAVAELIDAGAPPDADALSPRDALAGALGLAARSPARLVLVNMEDLWLETEPQNVPGTAGPLNWTRRARLTLEEVDADPDVRRLLEMVDRLRRAGHDDRS